MHSRWTNLWRVLAADEWLLDSTAPCLLLLEVTVGCISLASVHTYSILFHYDSDSSTLAIIKPTASSKLLSLHSAHTANVLIPPRLRKFADVRRVLTADSFLCSLSACWEKLIRFTWVLRLLVLLTVCLSHGTVDSATKAIWQSSAHSHVYSPFKAQALVCLTE